MSTEETVDIILLPHQVEFALSTEPNPALVGGLGSGKTRGGTFRLLQLMLDDPGINTLYTMPTYDLLRLRAIPGVLEDLELLRIPHILNKSTASILVKGYGEIYFRSYDRPEKLIAFEVAHAIVDEIDTLNREKAEEVWRKISERVRQTSRIPNSIGAVTTPDQGEAGFVYHKWKRNPAKGYVIIKARTRDNPFLPEGYIQQILNNYDPVLAALYINGDFVSLTRNKPYYAYDESCLTERTLAATETMHISIDFNVGGCVATINVVHEGVSYAVGEHVSHDTFEFVDYLRECRAAGHPVVVYPDASGAGSSTNAAMSDIAIIRGAGFNVDVGTINPFVKDRINTVNGRFANGKLKVNPDLCPQLDYALKTQGYAPNGEPEKFNDHPSIDDYTDSFGYYTHRRFGVTRARGVIGRMKVTS